MREDWEIKNLEDACNIDYGTRVVKKKDAGTKYPVYGGGGATFNVDDFNRENSLVISRFAMSEQCTRFVQGKFFLNDSGLTLSSKNGDLLQDFLNLQMLSLNQTIYDLGRGTAQRNLDVPKFRQLKIQYPKSIEEQKRIVSILDKAFAAIDKAKANAEQNLNNAKELFESYLWSYMSDKKWERVKLQDICTKVEYGSSSKSLAIGKVPVLRMGNIQKGKFDWSDLVYTDNKEEIEKYTLEYDDILFNRTNSPELVGKTAIYKGEQPAIFAGYLIRIHRKKELINADFLNFYLNSLVAFNYGKTVMSASINQANINGTKLKTYPIPLPPIETQEQIVNNLNLILSQTISLSNTSQKKLDDLEELKKSILHKAFNGEF